jgi:hypothetical protein
LGDRFPALNRRIKKNWLSPENTKVCGKKMTPPFCSAVCAPFFVNHGDHGDHREKQGKPRFAGAERERAEIKIIFGYPLALS